MDSIVRVRVLLISSLGALLLSSGCTSDIAAPNVPGGDAQLGKRLAARYQCGACHRIPEVPAGRAGMGAGLGPTLGPDLARFGRRSYIAGGIPNQPAALVSWLRDPPAMKPGTAMPNMGVSADDARHLAAYLYTLR